MLRIVNYSKSYKNGHKAVDQLSLDVQSGEIYGFIGHNGAGKTTTIKAIVGILDLTEGDIFVNGHSIKSEPLLCKQTLAYIPDNPDLYDAFTGIDYLSFIADLFGMSTKERENQIKKYSEAFELTPYLGDLIASYSHGMKQKLALISAFIHSPKLLVLDEPFVGLDPKASHTLKQLMREFCDRGSAIFFSTHVLEVAEKLCDQIAIIKAGKLMAKGKVADVIGNQSLENVFMELIDNESLSNIN
ncbi:ABC transporter ATP-binding protein [Cellulosilyticum lentocellum]|uniref:ABC transporter related protein n=1 Tax=Cellulosilyticum lentocellum (strain ATCC 49066 / DSM 5427 / NCIMB 11756 / RHM5) TaxID=642492 RepID=F2JK05_CELLD|nr:ABC transporter ATP-binding protein [Cellulosilyticum lentocellum]ADZ83287.1 ABC transporter related protein [Cellulosilyticum lentocellum DSM 5427]